MLSLGDARPCAERGRLLKTQADQRLIDSLRYLVSVLGQVESKALGAAAQLDDIAARVAGGDRLNASAFAFHSRLHDALKANDATRALDLVSLLNASQVCSKSLEVSAQGSARNSDFTQRLFDEVMQVEHSTAYEMGYEANPPAPENWQRSLAAQGHVLDLLRKHDPQTAEEIESYVSDILIISSSAINAGSSFRVHGLILLRQLDLSRSWTTYLENIVHEAAHLHLFMVWTQDPVFETGANDLGRSPIRKGERPMSGIFHAMFVLARTIRAGKLFSKLPEYADDVANMSTAYNNRQNPASFETKFYEARETLKNARLTAVGKDLMESCVEMVAA